MVAIFDNQTVSFEKDERLANRIFGFNVICWGFAGLISADAVDRWTVVRLSIAAQHFVVGALLLSRSLVGIRGNLRQLGSALPSLVLCGVAFKNSPAPHAWPWYAQLAFATATAFALVSLVFLGKNFAIFPALRGISTHGPYRWVRHPVYLAELLMVTATMIAGPNKWTLAACAALLPSVVWRVLVEERMLGADPSYLEYSKSVPYRLLPRIW